MHQYLRIYFQKSPIATPTLSPWFEQKRLAITQKVHSTCQTMFDLPFTLDSRLHTALQGSTHPKKERIIRMIAGGLGLWTTYNLLDAGLARLLALETLSHGTGPLGYIGISVFGARPWMGGSSIGSSAGADSLHCIENSKSFFHVFRDSHFSTNRHFQAPLDILTDPFFYLFLPRFHAVLSGSAHLKVIGVFGRGMGHLAGLLTPTLKFRFTPEGLSYFQNDPDYFDCAYRTNIPIAHSHTGLIGSLFTGINTEMFRRMWNAPVKVGKGAALLAMAWIIGKSTYRYLQTPCSQLSCAEKIKSYIQSCASCLLRSKKLPTSESRMVKLNRMVPAIRMIASLILFNTL